MNKIGVLSRIEQKSLANIVTEKIREAIIRGDIQPGERVTEVDVSDIMGVSRSPVREALRTLETDGLLVREGKKFYQVWTPTVDDIDEIYSLRTMIEILASQIIIDKLDEADYKLLDTIIKDTEKAVEDKDYFRLVKEDKRFHHYIVTRTHHSRLIDTWTRLMYQWAHLVYYWISYDQSLAYSVLRDHKNLLEGLKSKNIDRMTDLHQMINRETSKIVKQAVLKKKEQIKDLSD